MFTLDSGKQMVVTDIRVASESRSWQVVVVLYVACSINFSRRRAAFAVHIFEREEIVDRYDGYANPILRAACFTTRNCASDSFKLRRE